MSAPVWTVTVTDGRYAGCTWSGDSLRDCPVTILIPEGIVSARTAEEADRVRGAIECALPQPGRAAIGAASWGIEAERHEAAE